MEKISLSFQMNECKNRIIKSYEIKQRDLLNGQRELTRNEMLRSLGTDLTTSPGLSDFLH